MAMTEKRKREIFEEKWASRLSPRLLLCVSPQLIFFFFARSTTWFVRANRFISLLLVFLFQPIFIRLYFLLPFGKHFHSNDAQWIAHLSTKSDRAMEKKGGKNPPILFLFRLRE